MAVPAKRCDECGGRLIVDPIHDLFLCENCGLIFDILGGDGHELNGETSGDDDYWMVRVFEAGKLSITPEWAEPVKVERYWSVEEIEILKGHPRVGIRQKMAWIEESQKYKQQGLRFRGITDNGKRRILVGNAPALKEIRKRDQTELRVGRILQDMGYTVKEVIESYDLKQEFRERWSGLYEPLSRQNIDYKLQAFIKNLKVGA
jgi:hypothetical protein